MSEQKDSSEGGGPPEQLKPSFRRKRRKLSGSDRLAVGDLAFALYEVAACDLPHDQKWHMLRAKLLAWRAIYL